MKILCCGDSHTRIFRYLNKKQSKLNFLVCEVPGASAQGAVNPNSRTDALNIYKNVVTNVKADKILIMLGEVDCGFVIWVRSKKYNISVDEQIEKCVNNLFEFINFILNKTDLKSEDIIVTGSILPTISDSTNKIYLNGARAEVDISQLERTNKTIEYNNMLKDMSQKNGYKYIDITSQLIGVNGLVKDEFLNKNPSDHHLDNESTYKFWLYEIEKCL